MAEDAQPFKRSVAGRTMNSWKAYRRQWKVSEATRTSVSRSRVVSSDTCRVAAVTVIADDQTFLVED